MRGPLVLIALAVGEVWEDAAASNAGGPSAALAESAADFGFNLGLHNTSRWAFALNLGAVC